MKKYSYVSILGPTASGKSSLALKLAKEFDGEIVSCDSVQLYKGFDIGSAKATKCEQTIIKHHMIDLLNPEDLYDASQYATKARAVISEVIGRGKLPILVGGTGLYYRFLVGDGVHSLPHNKEVKKELRSLSSEELFKRLDELDPIRAKEIHPNDHYRLVRALEISEASESIFSKETTIEKKPIFLPELCVLLDPPRSFLHEKIEKRAKLMLQEGLLDEVRSLRKIASKDMKAMTTIGYKEANAFLDGEIRSEEDLFWKIVFATRQYAKRQVTFFKKLSCDFKSNSPKEDFKTICDLVRSSLKNS